MSSEPRMGVSLDRPQKPDAAGSANTLRVEADGKTNRAQLIAEVALTPAFQNAQTARKFVAAAVGETEITELAGVLKKKAAKVNAGDLSELEATLTAQVATLDAIFNELARRAALNMGEHLHAMDIYLRLALKAQGQCRASIEALAEIKNPHQVAFVKQANIAHGHQQVNNGENFAPSTHARARGENVIQANKLSKANHELLPDARTPALARRANQELETVGAVDRAKN